MSGRFFFCVSCQTERARDNLSERRRSNGQPMCVTCAAGYSERKYGRKAHTEDDYEPPAIPADVLDAYRELHTE